MSAKTALVVDDEEDLRGLFELTIGDLGYEVRSEADGAAARAWLETNAPTIIVLDIMMPQGNGLDLCRWIRAQPRLEAIPILISSALRDEETAQDALTLGAVDFLRKPFTTQSLREKIERMTRRDRPA